MPELAVIIVNYNTRDLLRVCLTELQPHLSTLDATVAVVDNASSDGSMQMVRDEFPNVSLIANADNVGFAHANNKAIQATDSHSVLLLNTDVFLRNGALNDLRQVMDSDDRIAVLGPRMYNGDGVLLASAHGVESLGRLSATVLGMHKFLPSSVVRWMAQLLGRTGKLHRLNYEAATPADVDWVSGACMFIRRSAIADVGLMDERYFMYMEDEDWCRRFRNAGYRVVYVPGAEVTHHVGKSSTSSSRKAWTYRDSRLIYHRKYNSRLYPVFWLMSNLYAVHQCALLAVADRRDCRPRVRVEGPAPRKVEA